MGPTWTGPRTAAAGLILANTVPPVGVVVLGWDLHSLLVGYWLESGAVGVAYVAKIRRAEGQDDAEDLPSFSLDERPVPSFVGRPTRHPVAFFIGHYGVFWLVHGAFILVFPGLFPGLRPASPRVVAVAAVSLAPYHRSPTGSTTSAGASTNGVGR